MRILPTSKFLNLIISFSLILPLINFNGNNLLFNLSKNNNLKEAANNLYRTMRKIKKRKYKSIYVCKIPNQGIGRAINERLKKASFK